MPLRLLTSRWRFLHSRDPRRQLRSVLWTFFTRLSSACELAVPVPVVVNVPLAVVRRHRMDDAVIDADRFQALQALSGPDRYAYLHVHLERAVPALHVPSAPAGPVRCGPFDDGAAAKPHVPRERLADPDLPDPRDPNAVGVDGLDAFGDEARVAPLPVPVLAAAVEPRGVRVPALDPAWDVLSRPRAREGTPSRGFRSPAPSAPPVPGPGARRLARWTCGTFFAQSWSWRHSSHRPCRPFTPSRLLLRRGSSGCSMRKSRARFHARVLGRCTRRTGARSTARPRGRADAW